MTMVAGPRKPAVGRKSERVDLLPSRELRGIVETVLRLAKSTDAVETEVHVDEVADALTRFANNGIHQNVFEHVVTVSVRTVTGGRTARATTNRLDEDSLRATIEASLSLAHSETHSQFSITMQEDPAASWAKADSADVREMHPQKLAERASEKAHLAVKTTELAPGRYTVILEPAAVLDLVGFMFYDFAATAVRDK